ncbi:MAG: TonB-dependent receptor plug domain-containing protein, partial [Bacteroidota bacterium]
MRFPFTYTAWRGFALLVCSWLLGHAVEAQTLSLKDEQGKPVVHATLFNLYNQEVRTLSDSSGHASLSGFRATDTLAISHVLFHPVRITKQALADQQYRLVMKHKLQRLQQFVLVASKTKEAVSEVPYRVSTITAEDIAFDNPQTTADALQSRGDVLIQKSQMGGGSPILRGFEANRVLIVVDGVRMNNAIYRSGHLQNAITVDNAIMERMEVQFGPSSVMYGSDALGGVMHLYTKQPTLAPKDSTAIHYNAYTRYSSANNENTAHVDVNIGQQQWGFLSSVTVSRFGDLRAGANRSDDYPDFGKVPFFADRIEGADTMILNSNQNIQRETGYDQIDLLQKIRFQPNEALNLQLNTQFSTSSDIPRFDRLNDIRDGELRFAEWYYGPQNRLMVALNAQLNTSTKWFDDARATLA